jgi:hypothetical protein
MNYSSSTMAAKGSSITTEGVCGSGKLKTITVLEFIDFVLTRYGDQQYKEWQSRSRMVSVTTNTRARNPRRVDPPRLLLRRYLESQARQSL